MRERDGRESLDLLGRRQAPDVEREAVRRGESGLRVGLLHGGVRRQFTIREARGMPEQILERHLPLRGDE